MVKNQGPRSKGHYKSQAISIKKENLICAQALNILIHSVSRVAFPILSLSEISETLLRKGKENVSLLTYLNNPLFAGEASNAMD